MLLILLVSIYLYYFIITKEEIIMIFRVKLTFRVVLLAFMISLVKGFFFLLLLWLDFVVMRKLNTDYFNLKIQQQFPSIQNSDFYPSYSFSGMYQVQNCYYLQLSMTKQQITREEVQLILVRLYFSLKTEPFTSILVFVSSSCQSLIFSHTFTIFFQAEYSFFQALFAILLLCSFYKVIIVIIKLIKSQLVILYVYFRNYFQFNQLKKILQGYHYFFYHDFYAKQLKKSKVFILEQWTFKFY